MGTTNALAKYIGNEFVGAGGKGLAKAGSKSALSSLVPSAASKIDADVATKAGTSLLNQATALGLAKNDANKWILNTSILDTDEGVGKIKDFMNPILGGGKTPSYQRFLEQIGEGEYQMGHRPNLFVGDSETKFPLSNMEADPRYLPKIYGDNEGSTVRNLLRLGNTGPDAQRSAKIIAQYQNQPNKMVKIFRQAPKDMNYGDWVGLTKEYADSHIGNSPDNQLWEREVPASEVMFAGDDINEWGYYPKEVQLDDDIANELNRAIEMSGADMSVAKRADSYLGGRMLDKNGKPITFYHSTPNEFSEFDDARLGENTGYDNTALGHFVTTDKDFSKRFIDIDNTGKTGRTMELQAKIQKPITHPYMAGKKYDSEQLDKIVEDYLVATDNVEGLEMLREYADEDGTSLYDAYMDMTFGGEDPFEMAKNERELLKNKGYDAVEIVEGLKNELVDGSTDKTPVSSYAVLNGENLRGVRHIPVEQEQLRYNSVPVKFNRRSSKELAPATRLGKDLNSVAEAMREYKAKNMNKMADNMIDEYSNEIFDWAAIRNKGEKAIDKIVGKDGLKKLKTFVEPAVNNAYKDGEYEANKAIATNFLNSPKSDKIVEASRELLPPGTKIYRRGSKDGISWTTDEALAKSSRYDGEPLEYTLTKNDRYIAPQFIDILQRTIENENQVLFKLK